MISYKFQNDGVPGKLDGGCPIVIGDFRRVPRYGYDSQGNIFDVYVNWGIAGHQHELHGAALAGYMDEFVDTTFDWVPLVSAAAREGGILDRPNMLRLENARISAELTRRINKKGKIYVTDLAAGPASSTKAYLQALGPDYDLERIYLTLADMSRGNRQAAIDNLGNMGIVYGKNFEFVMCRDVDLSAHIEQPQDLLMSVAGIHANADLGPSMRQINRVLSDEGILATVDWHTWRWSDPAFTYDFLQRTSAEEFGWNPEYKQALLKEFEERFGESVKQNPFEKYKLSSVDEKGAKELEAFWRGWMRVRKAAIEGRLYDINGVIRILDYETAKRYFEESISNPKIRRIDMHPNNELIMLEGHRPYQWYVEEAKKAGFDVQQNPYGLVEDGILQQNPWQILPDSSLHAVMIAQKAA